MNDKKNRKGPRVPHQPNLANPFSTYGRGFDPRSTSPEDVFNAQASSGPKDQQRRIEESNINPVAITFPPSYFLPDTAQSVDIRRLANVDPGTTVTLLRFVAPRNMKTVFQRYAIFNDALLFNDINFLPTVDGNRIYPFHGDPQVNFKIGLGLGPDLENSSLIEGLLYMEPGQVLEWTFTNNATVAVAAGVRHCGFVDNNIISKTGRFGG